MTDQTVPVPVDLLKRIVERTTTNAASDFGVPQELVSQSLGHDILALAALIPTPPKVGDTLTAEQVKALPVGALVVDDQKDSWLVRLDGTVLYYADADILSNRQHPKTLWEPYTLVYLPDRD